MAGLSLRALSKSYGSVPALRDLSIDVADGELLVLVGPSGCGKTTTLRLVAGLDRADAGTVEIGGRDVTALPPAERDVALVFQSYALFPHMTVAGNLAFGLAARRAPDAEVRARVRDAAETLGLTSLLDRRPRELSGGERQRVALGRAMVREPALFLLDEPLSNLDAPLRAQMRAEIVRLQGRLGTTMVHVTHDQLEALSMGSRVGVLRDGALQQLAAPREVYDHPANLFVARFMGSPPMNLVPARASGESLVWAGGSASARVPPGGVVLGVRPEHVHVAGSRWSDRAEPAPKFRALVDLVETVGDQTFLTVDAGGERIVARVEPAFRAARGDRLELWFDPHHIHVFDTVSERAIA